MSTDSSVLKTLLDRLMAGLLSGPGLNCRPHNSRQRIDLSTLSKLKDVEPSSVLLQLLGESRKAKVTGRVPAPRVVTSNTNDVLGLSGDADENGVEHKDDAEDSKGERAWQEQQGVFIKLRTITEDAKTYEQDTGVHVLSIGFPILQLPPGTLGGRMGVGRRVLAPIAFIPVNVTVKRGVTQSIELACHGAGVDLVMPNIALLAWLQQQLKVTKEANTFSDPEGEKPWAEIADLVRYVARTLELDVPEFFRDRDGVSGESWTPPEALPLASTPKGDGPEVKAQIVMSAVMGLYPMANQGLIEDMEALAGGEPIDGPIESFVKLGVALDAPAPEQPDAAAAPPVEKRKRNFADERLISEADPCQARAVRLAQVSRGLVVHGPPGTGKSQTITNIIGDHLGRGQRVLVVCDKRTALDVVYNRLRALGLGDLCAVVHDPQRDQRDLYKVVRAQLDELVDAPLKPEADLKLDLADRELTQLHAKLTDYWTALHGVTSEDGKNFHQLMGDWLALQDPPVKLEEKLGQMPYAEFRTLTTALKELFTRAEKVDYPSHAWADKVGIRLADFLKRNMTELRASVAEGARASEVADATIHPSIPPFAEGDLDAQAQQRVKLAGTLERVLGSTGETIRHRWAKQDPAAIKRARQRIVEAQPLIEHLNAKPLDVELAAVLDPAVTAAQLSQQVADLTSYEEIASRFLSFLYGSRKKPAAAVLRPYGLTLSLEAAQRVRPFLVQARERLVLSQLVHELNGGSGPTMRIADDTLEKQLTDYAAVLGVLDEVGQSPLRPNVAEALVDPEAAGILKDGLKRSPARAKAVLTVINAVTKAGLIHPDILKKLNAVLLAGKPVAGLLVPMSEQVDTLEQVIRVGEGMAHLPSAIKGSVKTLIQEGTTAGPAIDGLRKTVLAGEISRRLDANPHLQHEDPQHLQATFSRYRDLDQVKRSLVRDSILHRWTGAAKTRLLVGTGSKLNSLGAKFRGRFMLHGEKAMRLRKVIELGRNEEGGDPLFDLRPVWMASPETVAQLFPREAIFDVVIFDEASQCRLEEALPVLTRAHRLVVAGDQKQLPPTRFFESAIVTTDEKEPETDQEFFEAQQSQTEDLLAASLNLDTQEAYLDVHYRSRNADLIEFSNANFYGSRLQPIPGHPSNRVRYGPLRIDRVDGVYEKGRNPSEASRVVQIVRELLKRAMPPSIGIACFNLNQRNLIVEKLDELAAEDREFGDRLATARVRQGAASFEGLFVKNLENVQGDERDHIIISTTYGKAPDGKFRRQFGPLGRVGGGRRLNVLVTRARDEVHLVTSIPPEAYRSLPPVPAGQVPTGGWLLFRYLQFAEDVGSQYEEAHRILAQAKAEDQKSVNVKPAKPPSPFAVALGHKLCASKNIGSDVHWGNDGFAIELALHHPTRAEDVTIGVLCDSTRYEKAADSVEWDMFRTAIHESQGWKLHRIWTPHFFRDPAVAMSGVVKAVETFLKEEAPVDAMQVEGDSAEGPL